MFGSLIFRRIRRVLASVALVACGVMAMAQGGPPLITDDPGTPGNKHWEINVAYTQTRFDSNVVYELPHIDLNYGYGENVQLKLEGPLTIFNGDGSQDFTGLGYTNWGVKWRFQNDSKTKPALSIYPQVLFIGNERLGQFGAVDPGTDVFLPAEIMKSFGNLDLDAEAGVLFRQFEHTQYWSGVCAEYDLNKTLALLGEVHLIDTAAWTEDQIMWNLGFKQDIDENHSIIFSAGRSFVNPVGDNPSFQLYAGIQIRA